MWRQKYLYKKPMTNDGGPSAVQPWRRTININGRNDNWRHGCPIANGGMASNGGVTLNWRHVARNMLAARSG